METNVKSLLNQIASGKLKTNTHRVLNLIIEQGAKNKRQLMAQTGLSHQTVTSRISDLLDMGVIEVVSYKESDLNYYRYQSDLQKQVRNAFERKYKKFERWKKRGKEEFAEFLATDQYKLNI